MYLLQIDSNNVMFYSLAAAVAGLFITYFIIKEAVNGSRVTRYQEAQLKLIAIMAKNNGVDPETIRAILERAEKGFVKYDDEMKQAFLEVTDAKVIE